MSKNPKMCPMPFTSLHIEPDGRIKICCNDSPENFPIDNNGKSYNVTTHKLSEFWNSEHVRNVRKQFIDGKQPVTCKKCWQTELAENSNSVRIGAINRLKNNNFDYENIIKNCHDGYVDSLPVDFQVMVGNLCNLGCKMCGPEYSTNFSKFFKSRGFEKLKNIKFHTNQHNQYFNYSENSYGIAYDWPKTIGLLKIFSGYDDDIIEMVITGGEPTIVAENIEFLEYLGNKVKDKSVILRIATNCTNINKKLLSILDKFDSIKIHCSVDGMDEVSSIQRTYSNWSHVKKNIKMLHKWTLEKSNNREMYFHSVLTVLNFHHIPEFWYYIFKNYPFINISYLPVIDQKSPLGLELIPERFRVKLLKNLNYYKMKVGNDKILNNNFSSLESYINEINFSKSDNQLFEVLNFMQQLHPEYNIKEIYKFYYE